MSDHVDEINSVVKFYKDNQHRLIQFQASVEAFFSKHPKLTQKPFPIIHSIKTRLKDPDHLKDKIQRKLSDGVQISNDNLFGKITDLIGIRVLHLYQDQFPIIHTEILKYIEQGDWTFVEEPKAMTWDPESKKMYDDLKITTEIRSTFYTSVHYLIKPNNNNPNPICCEIWILRTKLRQAFRFHCASDFGSNCATSLRDFGSFCASDFGSFCATSANPGVISVRFAPL